MIANTRTLATSVNQSESEFCAPRPAMPDRPLDIDDLLAIRRDPNAKRSLSSRLDTSSRRPCVAGSPIVPLGPCMQEDRRSRRKFAFLGRVQSLAYFVHGAIKIWTPPEAASYS